MFKRIALVLVALALLAFIGCAKAPEAEMQKATTAMDAAKTAEAETYAPDAYRTASDTLNAAMAAKQEADGKFALFRSYSKAKALYVSAEALANTAVATAAAEKEKVKAEVTQKLNDVKMVIDSATVALKKAPRGKGDKADIAMLENGLAGANATYTDAQNDFNAGKYMVARTKLDQAAGQAQDVMKQIEAAKAMKKAGVKK
jgi:hypothetical protein